MGKRWALLLAPTLLFIAFILQTLVSLSLPIIKGIYLAALHINHGQVSSTANEVRIGLWGYCALNAFDEGPLDYGFCSDTAIGYEIDPILVSLTGQAELLDIALQVFTYILILHPIIAGLTLLALVPSFFVRVKWARILSLVIVIISAILSTVVFAIDVSIVTIARTRLKDFLGGQLSVAYGPAVWIALAALILLWAAVVASSAIACHCCGAVRWDENEKNQDRAEKN